MRRSSCGRSGGRGRIRGRARLGRSLVAARVDGQVVTRQGAFRVVGQDPVVAEPASLETGARSLGCAAHPGPDATTYAARSVARSNEVSVVARWRRTSSSTASACSAQSAEGEADAPVAGSRVTVQRAQLLMTSRTEHGPCHRKTHIISAAWRAFRERPIYTSVHELMKSFPRRMPRRRGLRPSRRPASQIAATTAISTRNLCCASFASTVARAGVLTGSTHASHAAFIWSYVFMSAR